MKIQTYVSSEIYPGTAPEPIGIILFNTSKQTSKTGKKLKISGKNREKTGKSKSEIHWPPCKAEL